MVLNLFFFFLPHFDSYLILVDPQSHLMLKKKKKRKIPIVFHDSIYENDGSQVN